ncbi:MAG: hypothetical protein AAF393_13915 [Pseudomonadota bacterium]
MATDTGAQIWLVLGGGVVVGALLTGVSVTYLNPSEPAQTVAAIETPDNSQAETSPQQELTLTQETDEQPIVADETVQIESDEAQETVVLDTPTQQAPSLDVVRVEGDGSALIAGLAKPHSAIVIEIDGRQIDRVKADASGSFVSFASVPKMDKAQPLRVASLETGQMTYSDQTVLVLPPRHPAAQPVLVLADVDGARMLKPAEPEPQVEVSAPDTPLDPAAGNLRPQIRDLSLDTISYDDSGDVVLTGLGAGQQFVRVYVDNAPLETRVVADDGNWRVVLPDVAAGTYTLRVDQVSATGTVMARVESPFRRVDRADVVDPGEGLVTIQPGQTLWVLAQERYGDGFQYVQIFEANKDLIRDANLIYPGQVFDLPAN